MTVRYEWLIEELDRPDGDEAEITDVNHADTYAEARKFADQLPHARIAVVRDRHDGDELINRSWAYIEGGALPEWCEDAYGRRTARVPAGLVAQFARRRP